MEIDRGGSAGVRIIGVAWGPFIKNTTQPFTIKIYAGMTEIRPDFRPAGHIGAPWSADVACQTAGLARDK